MPGVTRRTLLLSTAAVGMGVLSACTNPQTGEDATTTSPADPGAGASGAEHGAGTYNTQEVADELRYIKDTIRPQARGKSKRILITGSTAGLGQLAAAHLLARGHRVVAHARNEQRAADVRRDLPGLETVVIGELMDLGRTRALADQINKLGAFDVIIHNAGEYGLSGEQMLHANSLSPYLLTVLIEDPADLIYLSGDLAPDNIRSGSTDFTYGDTKLHVLSLAMSVARHRPGVKVNVVAPGWVPTRMGFHNGPHAPDNLREGYLTQVWLAEGIEPASQVTGEFFFHQKPESNIHTSVRDTSAQDALLGAYAARTGMALQS